VRAVTIPVEILAGDRDPVRALYMDPLRRVRPDWPVIDIRDAGHVDCIFKKQFADELVRWLSAR